MGSLAGTLAADSIDEGGLSTVKAAVELVGIR
jgi:hypothetical protein